MINNTRSLVLVWRWCRKLRPSNWWSN